MVLDLFLEVIDMRRDETCERCGLNWPIGPDELCHECRVTEIDAMRTKGLDPWGYPLED